MKKAFKVVYGRVPGTVLYRGHVSIAYITDKPDEEAPTSANTRRIIVFNDSPFDMIVSDLHDLLNKRPEYALLIASGKVVGDDVDASNVTLVADNIRTMIKDDLEKALDYWAPMSRTVHVRGKERQNA